MTRELVHHSKIRRMLPNKTQITVFISRNRHIQEGKHPANNTNATIVLLAPGYSKASRLELQEGVLNTIDRYVNGEGQVQWAYSDLKELLNRNVKQVGI